MSTVGDNRTALCPDASAAFVCAGTVLVEIGDNTINRALVIAASTVLHVVGTFQASVFGFSDSGARAELSPTGARNGALAPFGKLGNDAIDRACVGVAIRQSGHDRANFASMLWFGGDRSAAKLLSDTTSGRALAAAVEPCRLAVNRARWNVAGPACRKRRADLTTVSVGFDNLTTSLLRA